MATNLQIIESFTSSVETLNLVNIFTDKYDNYKLIASNYANDSATTNYNVRLLDSSGNRIADSEYDNATYILDSNASPAEYRGEGNSLFRYFPVTNSSYNVGIGTAIDVFSPNNSSSYTFLQWQGTAWSGSKIYNYKALGVHKVAEQITGIEIVANSGTMSGFNVAVYGVK